jgi:hypothetical protein
MSSNTTIDITDITARLTKQRRSAWIDAAMTQASAIEGKRRTRLLERPDVERLIDAVRAAARTGTEVLRARAYARDGEFVSNNYKWPAPITACEVGARGQPDVTVFDAKRGFGRAASVTVNGRAV